MADSVPHYNIAFAGMYGVGKSTLFAALQKSRCNETIHDRHKTGTSGKFLDKWTHRTTCGPGEPVVEVTLWDTGGLERGNTLSITKSYFLQTIAYILVYDTGDIDTLQKLLEWVGRAERESVTTDTDNLVFSLWGNCTDNRKNLVPVADVPGYAESYHVPPELTLKVNALSGENVEESYQKVIEAVHRKQTKKPSLFAFPGPQAASGLINSLTSAFRRRSLQSAEEEAYHQSCPPLSAGYTDQTTIIPGNDEGKKKRRCSGC